MTKPKAEKQLVPSGTVRLKRDVPTHAGDWPAGTLVTIDAVWREARGWLANVKDRHGRGISCCPVDALEPVAQPAAGCKAPAA